MALEATHLYSAQLQQPKHKICHTTVLITDPSPSASIASKDSHHLMILYQKNKVEKKNTHRQANSLKIELHMEIKFKKSDYI